MTKGCIWWAVACWLAVSSGSAAAGSCGPVAEYAQYKDSARTKDGRHDLALKYCLYKQLRPLQQTQRDKDECTANQGKILDAIDAAKDQKTVNWAIGGCP